LVVKPEGKRPPGRPSYRREDNIKLDLREIVWEGVDWINLAQHNQRQALVETAVKLRVL
jgi:hypothetical protein